MTIKVIIKGKEVKMTRKEFLRRFGSRKDNGYFIKTGEEKCQN